MSVISCDVSKLIVNHHSLKTKQYLASFSAADQTLHNHSMLKLYRPLLNQPELSIFSTKILLFFFFFLFPFILFSQTVEICDNGLDDDGDGLIDCFDTDCTCTGQCDDFYYTTCNADCYYVPPCTQISMGIQWKGTVETNTYSPLVAGDMDNDGIPEVVTYRCEMNSIYILDGQTGATKVTINSPTTLPGGTAPAIADLDKDGFGELIIIGEDRRLRCYEHTGVLKFTSSVLVGYNGGYRFSVPNIADFDHDGWPEINIGNQVYSGQSGALLASGGVGLSAGEHPFRRANGFSFNMPVAIDALPDSFCPDCDGLEIVAGNQVLSVNLVTGVIAAVVTAPAGYSDGFTSVADFDRDGDLDAIVQGQKNGMNYVYCWDIQTSTIMREYKLLNNYIEGASRVNIADLNGDGQLEINFVGHPWLYALKNDFTLLWKNPTNDVSSVTCSSVFDFCGDGSADVVYRGQTKLQILEGATGAVKWEDNCLSATHIENPLILDVDADGQTEVIIECGTTSPDFGTVVCYEAVGTPSISSRKVWNQHGYFNTNINEDLSVPRYQQNPNIVGDTLKMNTFMNQFFNPNFPSPDGVIAFDSISCEGDTMAITVQVCNTGDNVLPPQMPVSIYRGNPLTSAATWIGTAPIGAQVDLGLCSQFTFRVPRDLVINDSIYLALNDDHSQPTPYNINQFPVTSLGECGFTNNFDAFYYAYNPDPVALGNDTTICDNAIVTVNASGNDLIAWQWQDGSSLPDYVIQDPGVFFVAASDICGIVHTDTMNVFIDSSTVVTLGPDLVICEGETVTVGETGFDYYDWKPGPNYNCNNCASVTAWLPASGNVVLEAGFANGCKSIDTLFLTVYDTFFVQIDTFICKGGLFAMNGTDVLPGESHYFNFSAFTGCDSTILVNVFAKDTFSTKETVVICPGTTATIFGQSQNTSGFYKKLFTAINGCDSTHTVELVVQPLLALNLSADSSCVNEPTGALHALVIGGVSPFQYAWSFNAPSQPDLNDLPPGNYALTITDANNCTSTAATNIGGYPPIIYTLTVDSVQCFGQSNGVIHIKSDDQTLMYSLDNQPFVQADAFMGLPANAYTVYVADVYGCNDTAEVSIEQPGALLLSLPADTSILFGDSIWINVQTTAIDIIRFSWNSTDFLRDSTSLGTYAQPHRSISYALTLTDVRGCSASDVMTIMVERIKQVFVPNVIALNTNNDINSQMIPGFGPSVLRVNRFQVFDRWGDLVHSVADAAPGDSGINWNGTVRGKKSDTGVYVWLLEVVLIDGTVEMYKGDVTVLR